MGDVGSGGATKAAGDCVSNEDATSCGLRSERSDMETGSLDASEILLAPEFGTVETGIGEPEVEDTERRVTRAEIGIGEGRFA